MVINGTISLDGTLNAFVNGSVSFGVPSTGVSFLATMDGTFVNGSVVRSVNFTVIRLGVNATINGAQVRGFVGNWPTGIPLSLDGYVLTATGVAGIQLLSASGSASCSPSCPAGTSITFESPSARACMPLPRLTGFDERHSGLLPPQGPVSPGPSVAWTFAGNASERAVLPYRFTTTPVVGSDGTVYVTARVGTPTSSTVVFALDGSGAEKWRYVSRSASDAVTSTSSSDFTFITSATYGSGTSLSTTTSTQLQSRTQLRTVVRLWSGTNFTLLFGNPLPGAPKDLHVTYFDSVQVRWQRWRGVYDPVNRVRDGGRLVL
jgi:hypothetical protein